MQTLSDSKRLQQSSENSHDPSPLDADVGLVKWRTSGLKSFGLFMPVSFINVSGAYALTLTY